MKQRAVALGLAAAALLMFYALVLPKPMPADAGISLPRTTEDGPDGLAAAWRWLAASGIPVVSLRERYDHLKSTPSGGDVLITTVPGRLSIRADEQAALEDWVEQGNTLVVLAALDDTPAWAARSAQGLASLQRLLQIRFDARDSKAPSLAAALGKTEVRLTPVGGHPLLSGVRAIQVVSDLPAAHWRGQPQNSALLALARREDDGKAALWLEPRGAGQIVVSALAAPFSNAQITRADNARLLANLIAWSRRSTGRVLFDDAHQGLVSFYDPHAFFADARLHRSMGWILLLWMVWVLGALPLRVAQPLWAPLDETALIDASGRFFGRHVGPAAAARALLEHFFNELHRRLRQAEDGTPAWEWLALQPRVSAEQLTGLQRCWQCALAEQKVDLTRLQNLLAQVRGSIA
jgi:hypothetical protein